MGTPTQRDTGSGHRVIATCSRVAQRIADLSGHFAAAILLLLAVSVTTGVVLRTVGIDNSWTYDLDLFTLIWLAFFGAAFTSLRHGHVTSGIALENMLSSPRLKRALGLLRFVIVAGFLIVFVLSSYDQAYSSFTNHETTLDIVQWPVWIAKAALPLGAVAWLAAEIHKFLERILAAA